MALQASFAPHYGSGVTVTAGAASSTSTVGANNSTVICFTNNGQFAVHVRISADGAAATAADYPVPPTTQVTLSKMQDHTQVSYICPGGSASLHMIAGEGY
jgi:hypothetical protein